MSAKARPGLYSGILAKIQRVAWAAGLRSRRVARSGSRALESLGPKRYLVFVHDVAMAALAFYLAVPVAAALSQAVPSRTVAISEDFYALVAAIGVFGAMRLHRRPWAGLGGGEIRAVVKAAFTQTLLLAAVLGLTSAFDLLSLPLFLANWVLLTGLLLTPRAFSSLFVEDAARSPSRLPADASGRLPVLLVGAGDNAESFIKAADRDPTCLYRAVGVVDEMGPYLRSNVAGVEILGRITEIPVVVKRLASRGARPRMLVITEDRLSAETMRMLLDEATVAGLVLKRSGDMRGPGRGVARRASLRPVPVEELLDRRDPHPDTDAIRSVIANARVLIIGAGDAVGAALARQVCENGPAHLTLVDDGETSLFEITRQLQADFPAGAVNLALCDVRDRDRIRNIFARHRPQLVFHAAAMTHDEVAEDHPCEAVLANIMAPCNVADACIEFGATAMVLLSHVEAADPVNVLGQTRKISELYCRSVDRRGHQTAGAPRLMSLRVPDVLGAPESVDTRLEGQLANGGPLTLPGPETAKSLISAPLAATALLETMVVGLRGAQADQRAFAVASSSPVILRDLANQLIRLAGLVPEKDVKIVFTGPRHREPHGRSGSLRSETLQPTENQSLVRVVEKSEVAFDRLAGGVEELTASARGHATERVRAVLVALLAGGTARTEPDGDDAVTRLQR